MCHLRCSFDKSSLKVYQFLEYRKRDLTTILNEIDSLVRAGYGSYTEIQQLSPIEMHDIFITADNKIKMKDLTGS